jgi:hypothetical protein
MKTKSKTKEKPKTKYSAKYAALKQTIVQAMKDFEDCKAQLYPAYTDAEDYNAFDSLINQASMVQEQKAFLDGLEKALELVGGK